MIRFAADFFVLSGLQTSLCCFLTTMFRLVSDTPSTAWQICVLRLMIGADVTAARVW
jgi:hypothetical protein